MQLHVYWGWRTSTTSNRLSFVKLTASLLKHQILLNDTSHDQFGWVCADVNGLIATWHNLSLISPQSLSTLSNWPSIMKWIVHLHLEYQKYLKSTPYCGDLLHKKNCWNFHNSGTNDSHLEASHKLNALNQRTYF